MHIVDVPTEGSTNFINSNKLINTLKINKIELYNKWNKLYMIGLPPDNPIHPVIYKHPITNKEIICVHLGMTQAF